MNDSSGTPEEHRPPGRPAGGDPPDRPEFVPAEPIPVPSRSVDPASLPTAPTFGNEPFGNEPRSMSTPTMPMQVQVPPPAGRSRRRRGPIIAICAVLVGVLVLLTIADRVMVQVAGDKVSTTLQETLGTAEAPGVSFGGFPFLNQLATSHYSSITVTAQDFPVTTPTDPLQIETLNATLTDVEDDQDFSRLEIGGLVATTAISYESLSSFIGRPVAYDSARDGNVRIRIEITETIAVTGTPSFDAATQRLGLDDPEFTIGSRTVAGTPFNSLLQELLQITFPELVPGVAATDVRADPDRLTLSWEGMNVTIDR